MIWRKRIHKVVLRLPDSWSNWNSEMLEFGNVGFRGEGKPGVENLSEQRREPI